MIPMWSMYGQNLFGVRIGLPSNIFCGGKKPVIFENGGALCTVDGWYSIISFSSDFAQYYLRNILINFLLLKKRFYAKIAVAPLPDEARNEKTN